MTRLFNPCRKYREDLCALMSGDLAAKDRAGLENHLEVCTDCQKYRLEMGSVTALLAAGSELFPDTEPRQTTQTLWTRDFEAALEPTHSFVRSVFGRFVDWSRDMIWPCRRIWAGIAAIWVLILGLNASQRPGEKAQSSHAPSPKIMRALLALEGFLPESGGAARNREPEPPRPPSRQPRGERHRESNPS